MMTRKEVIKGLEGVLYDLKTCHIATYHGAECIKQAIKHLEVDLFDNL